MGPQLGLTAEETETVSWLVLNHLLLSHTAFKRDIDDPKTIFDIAESIQSPERLKLLLVMTVADMRAVSSRVWNGWKATLLARSTPAWPKCWPAAWRPPSADVRVLRAKDAADELLTGSGWNEATAPSSSASATPATGSPSTLKRTPATRG